MGYIKCGGFNSTRQSFRNYRCVERASPRLLLKNRPLFLCFNLTEFFLRFSDPSIFNEKTTTTTRTISNNTMPEQIAEHKTKRATFGMGCFWAGDALFGATPGVVTTCVGYAGGHKPSPTYKKIGDHTEVVDIEYDPAIVSFSQLLSLFWNNHEYGLTTKIKPQYASLILYHDDEQRTVAEKSRAHEQRERGEQLVTAIKKFDKFYPAEDYHQKYRLQSHTWLVETIGLTSGEVLKTSPLASKLNGYIAGVGTIEQFEKEILSFHLNEKVLQYLRKCVIENQGSGLYC